MFDISESINKLINEHLMILGSDEQMDQIFGI